MQCVILLKVTNSIYASLSSLYFFSNICFNIQNVVNGEKITAHKYTDAKKCSQEPCIHSHKFDCLQKHQKLPRRLARFLMFSTASSSWRQQEFPLFQARGSVRKKGKCFKLWSTVICQFDMHSYHHVHPSWNCLFYLSKLSCPAHVCMEFFASLFGTYFQLGLITSLFRA